MNKVPLRVAMYTGSAGLLVCLLLVAASAMRQSPLGPGENIEWLLNYLLLLGFPVSVLVAFLRPVFDWLGAPILVRITMVLAVVVNWAVIGYAVATLLRVLRRKPYPG